MLTNWEAAKHMQRSCPGKSLHHDHVPLEGTIEHPTKGTVHMTKLAQEYPAALCESYAILAGLQLFGTDELTSPAVMCPYGSQFSETFSMKVTVGRKRAVGTSHARPVHRQHLHGALAVSAGHQTRSSRVQPLIMEEMDPGKVVEMLQNVRLDGSLRDET